MTSESLRGRIERSADAVRRAVFALHRRMISAPRVGRVAGALARQLGGARSLLDVGCGDGQVARAVGALLGAGHVAGVDVLVQPNALVDVTPYDGTRLPFADGSFEAVVLSDVLHHAADPVALLSEALRVASIAVGVKDHFRFGPISDLVLLAMDRIGNAAAGVVVRGTYFGRSEWVSVVRRAGGRMVMLEWPLRIHDQPFRLLAPDRLQFAARIERQR